ncbi:hypothetical protein EIP86_008536 [Pleurotus ostreatoroseus]|nr:hypothetical protein EIP86_008536 [Pleurotus ostreatoroseus]
MTTPRTGSTDLGPVTVLPIRYFLDHVLPPLHPAIDLDETLAKLKNYGDNGQHPITKIGRWWGFPKNPWDLQRRNSRDAYRTLPRVVNAIAECGAPRGVRPSLQLSMNPECEDLAHIKVRGVHVLPNAYMVPLGIPAKKARWKDISVIGEYDSYEGAENKNSRKLCSSILQAFDDPRRRSLFGWTMENHRMRLWYCDRAQFLASYSFEFTTELRDVVHIFLSFLYAEQHQLGWDTTVKLVENPKALPQYDYSVPNPDGSISVFRTIELLSSSGHTTFLGSGTRTWKAIEVLSPLPVGELRVLKDAWTIPEVGRSALEDICSPEDPDESQQDYASASRLTAISQDFVQICPQKGSSYHDRTLLHVKNVEAYVRGEPFPDPSINIRPPLDHTSSEASALSQYRVHHRAVFKETCKPSTLPASRSVALSVHATPRGDEIVTPDIVLAYMSFG